MARVYAIGQFEKGRGFTHVKIGYTSGEVYERMVNLQSGNSYELMELGSVLVSNLGKARQLEKILHRKFSNKRIRGEWFKADLELRMELTDIFNKVAHVL